VKLKVYENNLYETYFKKIVKELKTGFLSIFSLLLAIVVVTFLRDDYNHFNQSFSEMGELNAPYYIFFNTFAFIIPGVLMWYFFGKLHLYLEIMSRDTRFLRYASFGWIMTGIFPLSYSISWLYWIHILGALIAFIYGPLGAITLTLELSHNSKWASFSIFSTVIAFLSWASILFFDLYLHTAIAQLITIGMFFMWYLLFLIKIHFNIN
jgi:hypothetical protein